MRFKESLTISLWSAAILALGIFEGFIFVPHVNADALYPLTFVSDVLSMTSPFHWSIAPVNGLFPDGAIVLVGKMIEADMGLNFVFYAAVYYLLVFFSAIFFLSSCRAGFEVACTASAATLILSIFGKSQLDGIAFNMSAPAHHAGVLPIALLVFGLMVRETAAAPYRRSRLIAAALVAAVVFSDIIAVVQIVIPVAALSLVLLFRRQLRTNLVLFVACVITGALLGLAARFLVDLLPWIQHGTTGLSLARFGDGWVDFFHAFPSIAKKNLGLFHATVAAVGLILGSLAAARDMLRREGLTYLHSARSLLALGKPGLDPYYAVAMANSAAARPLFDRLHNQWAANSTLAISSARFSHRCGILDGEILNLSLAGVSEILVYGPYLWYPAGDYEAIFDFSIIGHGRAGSKLVIEVVSDHDHFLAQRELRESENFDKNTRTLTFTLDGSELFVEFRIFATGFGNSVLRFRGMKLRSRMRDRDQAT